MAPLSDVVLISVVCAVTVFLSVLLVTVLCLRYRQKSILHSTGPDSNLYPQSRGILHSAFPFTYTGTRQWSAIGSTDNIHGQVSPGILEPPHCHTSDRRFSRMSTISTRNPRRLQKKSSRDIPLESIASPRSCAGPSDVENFDLFPHAIAELRADCTPNPKQPLQHDDNPDEDTGGRITSWPLITRKGSYYDITATMRGRPYIVDSKLAKRRSEGILRQVSGSPPKYEMPPLPALRPPGLPHLARHDSMLLSNKSLDTAGSSILDDPVGEILNDSVDLEAAREPRSRVHERYSSTGGWWLPASTRNGSISRIPQASSLHRYSSIPASSYNLSEERGSPRRSASMHYPARSSHILGVQSPISPRKLHVPPLGVARSLTSGPWIQSNICNQMSQPPPIYELSTPSSPESDHGSGQGQTDSAILKPITENGKNGGSRPLSNTNGCLSNRAHGSSSSLLPTLAKTSVEEQKKGHQRRKSVRVSISQQSSIPTSLSPTIEEPEDSSCKSTPRAKTVTSTHQDKEASELPSTTGDSQNPFNNDEQHLADGEGRETTPTPIERGFATNKLSATSPSTMSSPTPIDERPSIPRRSSFRRNLSTSLRSQNQAQSQPTRSTSVTSASTTTRTAQRYASTPSTTTTTNSVSGFSGLENYANVIANIDREAGNRYSSDFPARNAFALRENSPLMEQETGASGVTKPRPLPILPLPKLSHTPSRSRPLKFRVALTTINSVSNIAMHDGSDGPGSEDNNKENDGNAGGKSDHGNGTPTPTPSPSQYYQLERGEVAGNSIQQEGIASPPDKQEISAEPLASTPLRARTGVGMEQLTSSMVRTPGSMYDQFGFLKE
ncbi:hypothetical protein EMCG_00861 [[Emmonsia] crescens]|uniref:Uncharacterized protein n=1 Tax=[Emmonsia] crescens TaxID=73230 RepID=A0A0G2IXG0_9EURO|nr:hypothetical protein EMCG_00861 [Emmonsia crescens UAMH 3008]